jgi:epoxyqueuosine reductase
MKFMKNIKIKLTKKFVDYVLPDIRKVVPKDTPLVEPTPISPKGMRVPEVVAIEGDAGWQALKLLVTLPSLLKTLYYARRSSKSIKRLLKNVNKKADKNFFKELEAYTKKLGCSDIGYTEVPREYIFSNRKLLFKNAVVLIMDMNKEKIRQAPGLAAGKEVWRTYAELSMVVYKIAEFMRKKGYNAQPDPPIGGSTNFVLLAQKAGLGHIGKHGLLISERNGPSQRVAAIYTDIENLPITDFRAKEYSWIPVFCEICNHCVYTCPAKAIYIKPKTLDNGHQQYIDYKKCAKVFSKTLGCGVCIKECTFFKGDFLSIKQVLTKYKNKHSN